MSRVAGFATHVGSQVMMPTDSVLECFVPPAATSPIVCQFADLALAVLDDAAHVIRCGAGNSGSCPCGAKCKCVEQAKAWFADTEFDGPFSLRSCCYWLSLASGQRVDPVAVSERARDGKFLPVRVRRVGGRRSTVQQKRKHRPRRRRGAAA